MRTRRHRGGSGIRLFGARTMTKTKTPTKHLKYKNRPKNRHANLTPNNLQNLHTVNLSSPDWAIQPGNRNTTVPKNIQYVPRELPDPPEPPMRSNGVRVFLTGRKTYRKRGGDLNETLTENNVANLREVNTNTNDWKIQVGNTLPEKIPANLKQPVPKLTLRLPPLPPQRQRR